MPKHPCEDGLSKACFAACPAWARQALAYKLLHLLLPKQLTARLPKTLRRTFPRLPPGWPEGDPPPYYLDLEHFPVSEPPESGAAPPLFIPPWEPGPIHGPGPIIPHPISGPGLLFEQADPTTYFDVGQVVDWRKYATMIYASLSAQVASIWLKVGKVGTPTDNVYLQIWTLNPAIKPIALITGGTSSQVPASELPLFSIDQDYIEFEFPDLPVLDENTIYCIAIMRTTTPVWLKGYRVGVIPGYKTWRYHYTGVWDTYTPVWGNISSKIFGYPL